MRIIIFLTFIAIFFTSCSSSYIAYSGNDPQFKGVHSAHFNANETEVNSWYNFVRSVKDDGSCIVRVIHPEKGQVYLLKTYSALDLKVQEGLMETWTDDGIKQSSGHYKANKKEGEWTTFHRTEEIVLEKGNYKYGNREGKWTRFDDKSRKLYEYNYKLGKKDGPFVIYDSLANVVNEGIYSIGELVSETNPTKLDNNLKLPVMNGCDHLIEEEERKQCSQKLMLDHVYKNIKYPYTARAFQVEGTALIQFLIDKDGSFEEIKVIRGLCESIEKECLRVVNTFPKWIPGKKDGEPVKVYFLLPIKFRLE